MWNRSNRRRHHRRNAANPGLSVVESLERRDLKTSIFAAAVEGPVATLNELSADTIAVNATESPVATPTENQMPDAEVKYVDAFFTSFGSTTPSVEGTSDVLGIIANLSVEDAKKSLQEIEKRLDGDNAGEDPSHDKPDEGAGNSISTMSRAEWSLLRQEQNLDDDWDDDEEDWDDDPLY